MKNSFFLLSLLLITCGATNAQINEPTGAKAVSLGGIIGLQEDVWSVQNNPAAIGNLKHIAVGVAYQNRFNLTELSTRTAAVSSPLGNNTIGFAVTQFGYSEFNQNRIGLSFGKVLSENLSLGVQLNYLNTNLNNTYGSQASVSGNIGLLAKLNEKIRLSAVLLNINRAKLAEFQDERYPSLINLGVAYAFSTKVLFVSEIEKGIDTDANLKLGVDYQITKGLSVQTGYATAPSALSFGFGYTYKKFRVEFASRYLQNLGFTPQIALSFSPSFEQK